MNEGKKIFLNFNDWYANSYTHGGTSASRDWLRSIWEELEPTLEATRDDYKEAYRQLMLEQNETNCELTSAMLEFIKLHHKEGMPKFWKWYMQQNLEELNNHDNG